MVWCWNLYSVCNRRRNFPYTIVGLFESSMPVGQNWSSLIGFAQQMSSPNKERAIFSRVKFLPSIDLAAKRFLISVEMIFDLSWNDFLSQLKRFLISFEMIFDLSWNDFWSQLKRFLISVEKIFDLTWKDFWSQLKKIFDLSWKYFLSQLKLFLISVELKPNETWSRMDTPCSPAYPWEQIAHVIVIEDVFVIVNVFVTVNVIVIVIANVIANVTIIVIVIKIHTCIQHRWRARQHTARSSLEASSP